FSSRRRHTRFSRDWSSDVCSSDLLRIDYPLLIAACALAFISVVAFAITLSMVLLAGKDTHGYGEIMAQFLYLFSGAIFPIAVLRSEERRVGKECRGGA